MKVFILFALVAISCVCATNPFEKAFRKSGNALVDALTAARRPVPPARKSTRNVERGYIEQRIDQYHGTENGMFQQHFLSNYEHYDVEAGGPLFILVGGEYPVEEEFLLGGHFYDLAEEHGAAMFYLEHRFFGNSFPAERDADLDTLQYLTIYQSLLDTYYFVTLLQTILPHFIDEPVIMAGASLGGSLVTWYQISNFDTVNGAWASSAPIEALEDFTEALEVSGAALRLHGGQECHDRIQRAFSDLEDLFEQQEFDRIRDIVDFCEDATITTERGMWTVFEVLAAEFLFLAAVSNHEFYNMTCEVILAGDDDLDGLSDFQDFVFGDQCVPIDYEGAIEILSEDEWLDPYNLEARLLVWNICSQFGWFPSTSSPNQPFGSSIPLQFFHSLCEDVFDITPEETRAGIEFTNERFGGLDPQVHYLFSTQGRNDPFRPVGIQHDRNPNSTTVLIIEGAGHSTDFASFDYENDIPSVRMAKDQIAEQIRIWINDDDLRRRRAKV